MGYSDDPESTTSTRGDASWLALLNDLVTVIPAEALDFDSFPDTVRELLLAALHDVRLEVESYAGLDDAAVLDTDLAATLVDAAQDLASGAPLVDPCTADVIAQRLRDLGFAEAHRGSSLDEVRHVSYLLSRHAWRSVGRYAAETQWSASTLGRIGALLFALREQAEDFVADGHRSVARPSGGSAAQKRSLIAALLADDSAPESRRTRELKARARVARWDIPKSLVVLRFRPERPGTASVVPRAALVDTTVSPIRVIAPTALAEQTVELLVTTGRWPVAVSPPVAPLEAGVADRLAKRAILLAESGVLSAGPVIHCDEHTTLLWLHAEPEIRSRMSRSLLSPLLAEHPSSRMALAETMLAWLTTRDSAPAIAQRLGVHPQTVRYRWRRLQELFGDNLTDPDFIGSATLLLRSTVPLWQHGDLSDVEQPASPTL